MGEGRQDREAAVAGQFYSGEAAELRRHVEALLGPPGEGRPAVAAISPHAGYRYSGRTAGRTLARVQVPERVVVLAVNHWGAGHPVASWARGSWRTPLGDVAVDEELVEAIAARASCVRHDPRAHLREHSLEVQLPFLQVLAGPGLRIAPFSIASHDLDTLEALGEGVAGAVRTAPAPVLLVASTDMSHYEEARAARAHDEEALGRIRELDGPGLLDTVVRRRISMCGVAPTTAVLIAARALGATRVELVDYSSSGDVTGDYQSVVGYAGLVLS